MQETTPSNTIRYSPSEALTHSPRAPITRNSSYYSLGGRIQLACMTLIYPLWWFIYNHYDPHLCDSLLERSLVAAYALVGIVLSYLHPVFQRRINQITVSAGWLMTAHYFYLVYLNKMQDMYTVGAFIVVSGVSASLLYSRSVFYYAVFVLIAATIAATDHHRFPLLVFLFGLATVLLATYISTVGRSQLLALAKKNATDIETMLNNLGQGFIVVDKNLIVQAGSSHAAAEFFGGDPTGKTLGEVLAFNEKENTSLKKWVELCFAQSLSFVDLLPLAPAASITQTGRFIGLEYRPIYQPISQKNRKNESQLSKIICICSDKTSEKLLAKRAEDEATMVKILLQVAKDRQTFVEFIQETRLLLGTFQDEFQNSYYEMDTKLMMRILHSIKGNTSLFEMNSLSEIAHQLETKVSGLKDASPQDIQNSIREIEEGIAAISESIEKFLTDHQELIGPINDDEKAESRAVPVQSIQRILRLAMSGTSNPDGRAQFLRVLVDELCLDYFHLPFRRFEDLVKKVALEEKKEVQYILEKTTIKGLMSAYRSLVGSCIHLFRNSVDHGLEFPAEREQLGKPRQGTIRVRFERNQNALKMIIEDDGRGINPHIIGRRAVEKGLCTEAEAAALSSAQILELIFLPGFSTRDEISNLSGRGVGLDAVKMETEKLRGRISVHSVLGEGSQFTLEVPILRSKVAN